MRSRSVCSFYYHSEWILHYELRMPYLYRSLKVIWKIILIHVFVTHSTCVTSDIHFTIINSVLRALVYYVLIGTSSIKFRFLTYVLTGTISQLNKFGCIVRKVRSIDMIMILNICLHSASFYDYILV